uniref:Uncharacterized protein n=1 Tax=Tetranychus urticae TaxID=32264 RepID=T1K149_TETUR
MQNTNCESMQPVSGLTDGKLQKDLEMQMKDLDEGELYYKTLKEDYVKFTEMNLLDDSTQDGWLNAFTVIWDCYEDKTIKLTEHQKKRMLIIELSILYAKNKKYEVLIIKYPDLLNWINFVLTIIVFNSKKLIHNAAIIVTANQSFYTKPAKKRKVARDQQIDEATTEPVEQKTTGSFSSKLVPSCFSCLQISRIDEKTKTNKDKVKSRVADMTFKTPILDQVSFENISDNISMKLKSIDYLLSTLKDYGYADDKVKPLENDLFGCNAGLCHYQKNIKTVEYHLFELDEFKTDSMLTPKQIINKFVFHCTKAIECSQTTSPRVYHTSLFVFDSDFFTYDTRFEQAMNKAYAYIEHDWLLSWQNPGLDGILKTSETSVANILKNNVIENKILSNILSNAPVSTVNSNIKIADSTLSEFKSDLATGDLKYLLEKNPSLGIQSETLDESMILEYENMIGKTPDKVIHDVMRKFDEVLKNATSNKTLNETTNRIWSKNLDRYLCGKRYVAGVAIVIPFATIFINDRVTDILDRMRSCFLVYVSENGTSYTFKISVEVHFQFAQIEKGPYAFGFVVSFANFSFILNISKQNGLYCTGTYPKANLNSIKSSLVFKISVMNFITEHIGHTIDPKICRWVS